MKIKRLLLEDFRGMENLDLKFDQDFIILSGPNGSGKTSILESIFYASVFLAFPPNKSWELIRHNQDHFRINLETDSGTFEYYYGRKNQKRYQRAQKLDGVRKKAKDVLGLLPTVAFLPQDLNLLQLSPSLRREYLDDVLLQTDLDYEQWLTEYAKVVSQRNELLFKIRERSAKTEDLEFWDEKLTDLANKIIAARIRLAGYLNEDLKSLYKTTVAAEKDLHFSYTPSLGDVPHLYRENLERKKTTDIAAARTSVGPHRDDWQITDSSGRNLAHFLSRGEQRSAIICLKLRELSFLTEELGDNPVVLLDELHAELDDARKKSVFYHLPKDAQIFLTTTGTAEIPGGILDKAQLVKLDFKS